MKWLLDWIIPEGIWNGFRLDGHSHIYKWSEVKAYRKGGPAPKCCAVTDQWERAEIHKEDTWTIL